MALSFCGKRIILSRNTFVKTPKRNHGYIILLPEIGEDLPDKDPLLKQDGLPEFNTFTIERSMAAIGKQTVLYEQGIERIVSDIEANKNNLDIVKTMINPLEELNVPLETTWGIAKTLFFGNQSLMPTKYYQSIHKRMIQARSSKHTSLPIYNACKKYILNTDNNLTLEQRRILEKHLLEGRLNGLDNDQKKKKPFESSVYKINTNVREFQEKVEIATKMFTITITNPEIFKDFPDEFLKNTAIDKNNYKIGPWKITLEPKIVSQFLQYCPNHELRWKVWNANNSRCAQHGENTLRNSGTLEDIRDNRIRQAKVLGYKSWSHMSMETKSAGSLENIYTVMDSLLKTAKPAQENELEELKKFAEKRGFNNKIKSCDVDYWIHQHLRETYNIKNEIIQNYFPLPYVINGLFNLVEKLFNIKIIEGKKTDVWHSDVRFFDIIDLNNGKNEPIAHFYLDPYERMEYKMSLTRENSWMVGIQSKSKLMNTKPLAALIFNFRPPTGDAPSLLSIKDVAVLFHKVGNVLQQLLTKVEYSDLAGVSNIEWDAVEISGHFMENWLYEPAIIKKISNHYQTNESLPDELVNNLKNLRSHMAGYNLSKELFYGRFDLELHELGDFWLDIIKRLYPQHFVIPREKEDSFITAWSSIFSGNWGAAYYSNLWSEMIAADAFSAFHEIPSDDDKLKREIGERFRDTFLSLGGSVPAGEVFRRFRGRDPNSEALLNNLGLKNKKNQDIK